MAKEQLKPKKGVVVTEINGVKYFKLQSNYPGDYTKNCGLLGSEIDENFYFLRSNDIDKMSFKDGILTLTRLDGDTLSADVSMPFTYTFEYNKDEGKIIITDSDGNVQELDGFVVEGQDVRVATDASINGDGTQGHPLTLSNLERTGTYAPAKELLDLTDGSSLPDGRTLGQGYRVVTKEIIDNFGLMYNFDGVSKIQEALDETGSLWRVPTRKDWADLLNAAEYCDDDRDHDTKCVNEWTGKNAGARAKSINLWKYSSDEESGLPVGGEDNLPNTGNRTFRVFPLGDGDGSRGARDEDYDIEGFSKRASFWTISPATCKDAKCTSNVFTRTFAYDTRKSLQESSKPSSRMSLRLVRDYEPGKTNANEFENILGYDMPCVLITNDETKYGKIWTSINVGFKEPEYSGVTSQQWSAATNPDRGLEIVYFINEWDGQRWFKKQMREGDSVVITDGGKDESGNTIYNHEWRVYSGETEQQLIDTAEALKEEFQEEIDAINDRIDQLSGLTDSIEIVEVEPTSEDILRSYELHIEGEKKGVTIDIPKDEVNFIESITLGHVGATIDPDTGVITDGPEENDDALLIKYKNSEGKYGLSVADIEEFIFQNEFKDGFKIEGHDVYVKIDENSEPFLTVSPDGVKLDGVQNAIDTAVATERERAEAAEQALDVKIDTEVARLDGKDIANSDSYEMSIDGLVLNRENGETIEISFNGNFGTVMPIPLV